MPAFLLGSSYALSSEDTPLKARPSAPVSNIVPVLPLFGFGCAPKQPHLAPEPAGGPSLLFLPFMCLRGLHPCGTCGVR